MLSYEGIFFAKDITTSLANNVKASNTKNLKFIPLENLVKLVGRFGYWIKDEDNEYVSYEIYSNKKKNKPYILFM